MVTACATGAHAIGDAARLIQYGDADVMVAGGAEAAICRIGIAGFIACRALSTGFNDTPAEGLAPLRQGPRRLRHGRGRRRRGARGIRARQGARREDLRRGDRLRPVRRRLSHHRAGRGRRWRLPRHADGAEATPASTPADIDYVNAHGTSTPLGDEIELGAVERLFGNAAGKADDVLDQVGDRPSAGRGGRGRGDLLRAWRCATRSRRRRINLDNPSVETPIDLVPHKAKPMKIDVALSNTFGFGGTNASLVFKKVAVSAGRRSPTSAGASPLRRLHGHGGAAALAAVGRRCWSLASGRSWTYRRSWPDGAARPRPPTVVLRPGAGVAGDRLGAGAAPA